MNYYGLLLGVIAFFTIGLFHPLVAKAEYYFGKKVWWIFLLAGIVFCLFSLVVTSSLGSIILGTIGFGSFWSTHEIFKQHQRVIRGQAKRNPQRTYANAVFCFVLTGAFYSELNFKGILVGAATFAIIALARYICIKGEYYFSKRFWIVFAVIGLASVLLSLVSRDLVVSTIFGINGFTFFWGIGEIIEQEKRVEKGWFPKNPGRT